MGIRPANGFELVGEKQIRGREGQNPAARWRAGRLAEYKSSKGRGREWTLAFDIFYTFFHHDNYAPLVNPSLPIPRAAFLTVSRYSLRRTIFRVRTTAR